jgi:hypothetical protein
VDSLELNNDMITVSKVTTAIAVFLILATNGLMIVNIFSKPLYVTSRGLTARHVISKLEYIAPNKLHQEKYDTSLPDLIRNGSIHYSDEVEHLCVDSLELNNDMITVSKVTTAIAVMD